MWLDAEYTKLLLYPSTGSYWRKNIWEKERSTSEVAGYLRQAPRDHRNRCNIYASELHISRASDLAKDYDYTVSQETCYSDHLPVITHLVLHKINSVSHTHPQNLVALSHPTSAYTHFTYCQLVIGRVSAPWSSPISFCLLPKPWLSNVPPLTTFYAHSLVGCSGPN